VGRESGSRNLGAKALVSYKLSLVSARDATFSAVRVIVATGSLIGRYKTPNTNHQ